LISRYKLWTIKFQNSCNNIKNNILQNDTSSLIEEKIISIAISSIFVYIGVGILGLFGVYTGGFIAGAVLFLIGWGLSKLLNKKIFGTKREEKDLKEEELALFSHLDSIQLTHKNIRDKMNNGSIIVHFTEYVGLKKEFENSYAYVKNFSVKNLAYKYRMKYPLLVAKYKKQIVEFEKIYTNKKG
jgi:hypothetical protein